MLHSLMPRLVGVTSGAEATPFCVPVPPNYLTLMICSVFGVPLCFVYFYFVLSVSSEYYNPVPIGTPGCRPTPQ